MLYAVHPAGRRERPAERPCTRKRSRDDGHDGRTRGGAGVPGPGRHPGGADPRRPRRVRRPRPSDRASSRGGSGSRSRRSPTSAARSPTPGLVRRIGTGFALGRRLAELGGAYLGSVDQVQEFYEASRACCRRLRGDGPVRGPRRARGDVPRAPRRPPAGPPDVAASAGGCRPSRPRPARRRSRRCRSTSSTAGSPA